MVFSSPVFLFLFLPLTLLLVWLAGSRSAQNTVLLFASLVFYAWGEAGYVFLMLASIAMNHLVAFAMERSGHARVWLAAGVVLNLATLTWFKYASFLLDGWNGLTALLGAAPITLPPVDLPLGVSFFVFHSISYLVDIHRGKATAQHDPKITALYITLFPQLVAGPIVRYRDVARQFTERVLSVGTFTSGVQRFVVGLSKKLLIADECARIADGIFALPSNEVNAAVGWLGAVAYAIQIYFDFSGYSDMAIGLGRMFGFEFLENFNRPYIARSLREFWKRWHISLSNWFRDYLYIPLGGDRNGVVRTYLNLFIVFFLTGLWHGASWSFVVWGMLHGCVMVVERLGFDKILSRAPRILSHAYLLLVVLVSWIFFRVTDITSAWRFVQGMFGVAPTGPIPHHADFYLTTSTVLALGIGIAGALDLHRPILDRVVLSTTGSAIVHRARTMAILLLFVLCAMSVANSAHSPFIYFRF